MSAKPGKLLLVPNTLDFGVPDGAGDLRDVLPDGVLQAASLLKHWVAENAKTARAFLKRVDAVFPLALPLQQIQIAELPRPPKGGAKGAPVDMGSLLAPVFQGNDLGLISEAGMPAVADPGAALAAAAHAHQIEVVPLVGPSSLLLALAASGLNGQSFAFVGYLPVEPAARAARIRELESLSRKQGQTQLMIETPYRNRALLDALLDALQPTTRLSVSCGLTMARAFTRSDAVAGWRKARHDMPPDVPAVFAMLAA